MRFELSLGTTARNTYLQTEDCKTMLPLDGDGSGGLRAATETVQTMLDDFGEFLIVTSVEEYRRVKYEN